MRWVFIDEITECEPGRSARALKRFSGDEALFQDHFPGYPILPGVLQIEMLAHAGSRCIAAVNAESLAILGSVKSAKFYKPIEPPCVCEMRVEIDTLKPQYAVAHGGIYVNDERMSAIELMFVMIPREKVNSSHFERVKASFKTPPASGALT